MKKVSIKLVKEAELDYGVDKITRPGDAAKVIREYIGILIVRCLLLSV